MRHAQSLALFTLCAFLATTPALAGPPLICHAIPIGAQRSLPWIATEGWNGTDPAYDVSHLTRDALALLTPSMPVDVRMETLRRAAIYSARRSGVADELLVALMGRVVNAEARNAAHPPALFDAGYFAETLRQATQIYSLLQGGARDGWMLRDVPYVDGMAWMRAAVRQGGDSAMRSAVATVERATNGR